MVGSKSNIVYQKGLEDDLRKRRPDISKNNSSNMLGANNFIA